MRFCIVTPSFNQAQFIERTIRSVLDQDVDLEYVIVDGSSTDGTAQILEHYGTRLRWMSEPDRGQADAVNKGIRLTGGDIIGWLNSDDVYRDGALRMVRELFEAQPRVDVLYGDADLIDALDQVIGRYYTEPWSLARLYERPFLSQPAVFFRRCVVDRWGLLDESLQYTMDYEYWLRVARGGARFAYLPMTLAGARLHPETKTSSRGLDLYTELHPMLRRYLPRTPDSWILSHAHAILDATHTGRFSTPLAFGVAVALVSVRLALHTNGAISPGLARSTLRTLATATVRTVRGDSVADVLRRR